MSQSPNFVDVFICGSGSAGLCAATWLARYGLRCKIVDSRDGPMAIGQADGVQCRTVEVFDSFGIAEELLRESYHVIEVAFWGPGARDGGGIVRNGKAGDTEKGLSRMPHVILNQARINGLLLETMKRFNNQEVEYGYTVEHVQVDSPGLRDHAYDAYPVTVTTKRLGKEEVFHAKYVLGCDGAHSAVRKSLGIEMVGDSTDSVWGVMDIYPRTDFPDIRKKAALQSTFGSLLLIPREGGSLSRCYIELPTGTNPKKVTLEDLHAMARKIFFPYKIEFAETTWWSAYSIGQRLANLFSKDNRVFLTGDACHTHSPKAGQGMNVSLQDGYNIGWKLASVLNQQSPPSLLETYNIEREKVAADLIAFDREFARAFSSKSKPGQDSIDKQAFSETFVKAGRYTAGLTATYDDSVITRAKWSKQSLAKGLMVGMRLPSTQVVRFADANAIHLAKACPSDGRWRLIIFAGDIAEASALQRLNKLGSYLAAEESPVHKFTPPNQDVDSFIETLVVLTGDRGLVAQENLADYFWPETGKWKIRDLHKVFVDEDSYNSGHGRAYDFYGIDPKEGAVAIVRPDQYVSMVTDLDSHKTIGEFFEGFCLPRSKTSDCL